MTFDPKGLFYCDTLDAGGRVMLEPAEYRALGEAIHKALQREPCFNGKTDPGRVGQWLDVLAKHGKKNPWRPLSISGALTLAGERPTLTLNPAYLYIDMLAESLAHGTYPEFVSLDHGHPDGPEGLDGTPISETLADDESRYAYRMDAFGRIEGDAADRLEAHVARAGPGSNQARALRLRVEGETQAEIARRLGVTERTVRRWLKEAPKAIAEAPEKAPAARPRPEPGEWVRMPENRAARDAIMAPGCQRGTPAYVWPDWSWKPPAAGPVRVYTPAEIAAENVRRAAGD